MTSTPDDTTADTSAIIAALRTERDAALAREAVLAEALAQRNSEYGERIEQQSATIDVLKVMSASPGDTQPVFDLIAQQAVRLCNVQQAAVGILDGTMIHLVAQSGFDPAVAERIATFYPRPLGLDFTIGRAIINGRAEQVEDITADPRHIFRRAHGAFSNVAVPMLRDGKALGAVTMGRWGAGRFSDSQVALLQTFAEQAVIAITSAETYRALQTRTNDLQETLEYQTATSDVLKVISRSTFDLQPILDTLVETAARLCEADSATVMRRRGDVYRAATAFGYSPEFKAFIESDTFSPGRGSITGRVALEGRAVHVVDAANDPQYTWTEGQQIGKFRTMLGVPLLREDALIGVIVLARSRVAPFSKKQIELVTTFADQAVIAIENTRLITEQREALEQQTATAEVLQVINSSPGELAPVFDAMLERAMRLIGAAFGIANTYDGKQFRTAALHRVPPALAELWSSEPPKPGPNSALTRLASGEDVVHIEDYSAYRAYKADEPRAKALVDIGGVRTYLAMPLRKDGRLLGTIAAYRQEVRPFSDKQIALLQSFAAQAVIAMENARLINEQREALEQQTATAEVLEVINSSPGNLAPVFDAMLEKAMRLCGAAFGLLFTYDGEKFHMAATRGATAALAAAQAEPWKPTPGGSTERLISGLDIWQISDIAAPEWYDPDNKGRLAMADLGGGRSTVWVALRKDDAFRGVIMIYRQEVRPFTDRQIALLQNFAAQAVIAMENARLITEQREALEQQTATAEVLQVINASPGNLTPVFDAMLEKACHLCEAEIGTMWVYEDEHMRASAIQGAPSAYAEFLRRGAPHPMSREHKRLLSGERFIHTADLTDTETYRSGHPLYRAAADFGGVRTFLAVPLRKDEQVLGHFGIYRQEVRPFTDKQIALLQNFAAQAVIAMENARLLDEIRQRQEELRVTFENMGGGVAMFDETQHLVAWNRKFQDILDVPDDIIARRQTFSEYVRYLAERGEYGPTADPEEQIRRLIEQAGQSRTYERTRPDGRVIEVRNNPVPGGGFVLIFSDITERKRNEAEIRAARDAAEEASRTIEAAYRDLKAAQANLIQAEKMASLGQLTAGIAHEIKNPLNFVNNFAALSVDLLGELKETAAPGFAALTDKQRAEVEEVSVMLTSNLEKITEHGKRADGIVKAMLEHSRGSSGERRVVDLNALIDEALNLAYHGARAQDQSFNITLERDFGEDIAPIEVNPQDMTRVFLNLFANGFYAVTRRVRDGGDAGFAPTLKVTTSDAGEALEIRVQDNGTGIPADIKDKLFQPFFTTKPTGEGTGLGLSITYDIVTQQHGGNIAVDSKVGEYSEFTIRLPRNP